jgi:hypothetical protein
MGSLHRVGETGLSLPPVEEVSDGVGVHIPHVSELGSLLRVEKLSIGINDCERGNSLLERDIVLFGYVEVFVKASDVDMNENKVLVEKFQVWGLVKVDVEYLAVATPVSAKVEDDTLVLEAGLLKGRGDVGFGIGLGGIEMFLDGGDGSYRLALGRGGSYWGRGRRCGLAALAREDAT